MFVTYYNKNRKYPRTFGKSELQEQEYVVDMGISKAVGIVAGTLIAGMTVGYLISQRRKK
jgi:hypothetical protein